MDRTVFSTKNLLSFYHFLKKVWRFMLFQLYQYEPIMSWVQARPAG